MFDKLEILQLCITSCLLLNISCTVPNCNRIACADSNFRVIFLIFYRKLDQFIQIIRVSGHRKHLLLALSSNHLFICKKQVCGTCILHLYYLFYTLFMSKYCIYLSIYFIKRNFFSLWRNSVELSKHIVYIIIYQKNIYFACL